LVKAFAPDVLVTQLGIDTYHTDPLTHLQITTRGYVEAVKEIARWGIPWLALGGGGYDLSAVARSWTLAYGVMLDVEWPDALPASLLEQVGSGNLRDTATPVVPDDIRQDARKYAEDSVEQIKERVFPTHSL
jgi:acetoin utilization protein AcuC